MKSRTIALAIGLLLGSLIVPADSATTLRSLDKRLRLLTALYLNGPREQQVSAFMSRVGNASGTIYAGTVSCPTGWVLTGGGTDWPGTVYSNWDVNYSFPQGQSWTAQVYAAPPNQPGFAPQVYAVCLSN